MKWNETNSSSSESPRTDEFFLRATVKSEQKLWQWDRNSNPKPSSYPATLPDQGVPGLLPPSVFLQFLFFFAFFFFLVGCESNVNREYISFSCRLTHPHNQTPHATPSLLWKKYHSTHTQLWPLPFTHLPRPLPPTGPMACHAPHCCCHSVCLRIWRFFPALPTHFFHFLFFAGYAAFVRLYVTAWAGIFTDSVLDEHVNVWFLLRVELKQWAGGVFKLWLDMRQRERSSSQR